MSGKLDQSLDTILAARRKNSRPIRRARRVAGTKAAAPVGGIKKTTKPVKKVDKVTVPAASIKGESKILVSNLPSDVNEQQIKDYFQQTVAPVKKVILNYGPNGQSRGVANVIFTNTTSAAKAVAELNGVKVDNRPMKVEVILDGKNAPVPPEPKKLADRVSQPKTAAKPKPATETKVKKGTTGRRGATRGRGGRAGSRTKKTAEQLDAEMVDYFQTGTGTTSSGGAVQAPNGDTNMDDDVL